VSALDATIDDLYQRPLSEFTVARNALAKTLTGADAKRVRALAKPTVVPWAVNQVYWRARGAYDAVMKGGEALRAAQIAALEGREADVRGAGETHRRAIAAAVSEATRLAAPTGAKPDPDVLARTFESLSLASRALESPGRLTGAVEPAGFEALAGIGTIQVRTQNLEVRTGKSENRSERAEETARIEAERKERAAAISNAEAQVARAEMRERSSRETWERAHDDLLSARQTLADLKRKPT
jgi:hypothetical protein